MSWTPLSATGEGRFADEAFCAEHRCSIGRDRATGSAYLSIPVANRLTDYEEYYRITAQERAAFLADAGRACTFAERCRRRELDDRLIIQPGADRGAPG